MHPEFVYLVIGLVVFTFVSLSSLLYFDKKHND